MPGGQGSRPVTVTDTADTIVQPGDATNNAIRVNLVAGGGTGGTSMTDDAVFTPATTAITPAGALFDDVTPDSVDEGDGGAVRMSANRNLYVRIRDNAGNERGLNVDASGRALVDASGVAVPVTDNAGSLTVDGTITANAGTGTFNTSQTADSTATNTYTRFADLGANVTLNVKASAGNVFSLWCHNDNTADRFIQLHNTATIPAGGATPLYVFQVDGSSQVIVGTDFFGQVGARFSTGIAFAFSTTKDTYTAAVAGDHSTMVHYA